MLEKSEEPASPEQIEESTKEEVLTEIKEVAQGYVPMPERENSDLEDIFTETMDAIAEASLEELEDVLEDPAFNQVEESFENLADDDKEKQSLDSLKEEGSKNGASAGNHLKFTAGLALISIGAISLTNSANRHLNHLKLERERINKLLLKLDLSDSLQEKHKALYAEIESLKSEHLVDYDTYDDLSQGEKGPIEDLDEKDKKFIKDYEDRNIAIMQKSDRLDDLELKMEHNAEEINKLKESLSPSQNLPDPKAPSKGPQALQPKSELFSIKNIESIRHKKIGVYGIVAASLVAITSGSILVNNAYSLAEPQKTTSNKQYLALQKLDYLVRQFRKML